MTKLRSVAARTVQVAVSAVFFYAAYQKLTGGSVPTHTFQALGLGEWFRYFTGLATRPIPVGGGVTLPLGAIAPTFNFCGAGTGPGVRTRCPATG